MKLTNTIATLIFALGTAGLIGCGLAMLDETCHEVGEGRTICVESATDEQALQCETNEAMDHVECFGVDPSDTFDWNAIQSLNSQPGIRIYDPLIDAEGWILYIDTEAKYLVGGTQNACRECALCSFGQRDYGSNLCGLYCRGCNN